MYVILNGTKRNEESSQEIVCKYPFEGLITPFGRSE